MCLNKLDNFIVSSKELEYLENEQDILSDRIKAFYMVSQDAITVHNIIGTILDNSPELEQNRWHKKNNIWILNGGWKIEIRKHSDNINFYKNDINFYEELFNNIGIKYRIDKCLDTDSDYDIYDIKYTITIDEYEALKKYFDQINKSEVDIDKLTKLAQKSLEKLYKSYFPSVSSAYVDDNLILQHSSQSKQLVKKTSNSKGNN